MISPKVLFLPRRRFFVKRALQTRLILGMIAASVLSFSLVLVDYYFSFGKNAGWNVEMLSVFLKAQKLPMIQLVVFVFVLTIITLKLSHRVAGPLVNLEKSLARVGEGDLTTRVQLRPRDELKDIRDAFNVMMEGLNSRVNADRAQIKEIHQLIEKMIATPDLAPAHVAELNCALVLLSTLTTRFK